MEEELSCLRGGEMAAQIAALQARLREVRAGGGGKGTDPGGPAPDVVAV